MHGDKAKVVGHSLSFNLNGQVYAQKDHFSLPFVKGKLFNPHLEMDFRGQMGKKDGGFSPEHIQLIATGHIIQLPIEEGLSQQALENGTLYIQIDGSKNLIVVKAEAESIKADIEIHHFIQNDQIAFDASEITFICDLQDFPLEVISPFISEDFAITDFLGKKMTLHTQGTYTPSGEPRLTLELNARSPGFTASLALSVDGTLTVDQDRPSYIYWEINPERYETLIRSLRINPEYESKFSLTRPTSLELTISQFICPATSSPNDVGHFLCQSGFVGKIHLGTTIFKSKQTQELIIFQEIMGDIKGENFSKAIDLALSGNIVASDIPESEKSAFSFKGEMLNFWTQEGSFNRQGLTVKGVLTLDLLPVRQITGLVPLDKETREILQAVLGGLVNARIYGEISQLSGPLTVDIKASNFKALLPLTIYLRDYVNAEITLTEAVSETLLKDIAPLIISGAYSDHPLKVYIDPQGFMIPINPYSLAGVRINNAIIDIGKIRVRNGGQIQSLMEFLKAQEVSPDGLMQAWFTPIFMTFQDGVAFYKRFDILLASNVHIALWGGINLINDQVNMTLAIAPSTLAQRFKISGLSKKELFQVKMRGTTHKLELDWKSAYTRIAFIVAKTAGGHIGQIIGGILENLISSFGEEPSPPPTTDPLPWENLYSSDYSQRVSSQKRGTQKRPKILRIH